ncbi:YcdB/YcdC domain-containing protein [Desulfosporosinus shakirovi]|uniref:YcdB/YcdC domain-containing protein n=1 Tax=Desulfosporosinus shakirovi TaxID=2885154 RepID=UPI001E5BAB20|nr:YcdB/YcdC domain-containing protein [Desulfosporosinus sp. SRJS8]MCB8817074.1 S-layer homology domain-containing protein [Desulfosporosinus sp. SRJS8]
MKKTWRSFLAVCVVTVLLVPAVAPMALAREATTAAVGALAKSQINLEKAIQIVKTNFEVPSDYTDFSSSYNTYDDRQVWALRWSGTAERAGEFAAEVNAVNGDIVSMNYWNNDESGNSSMIPAISKEDAQDCGYKLLNRLLGQRAGELKLVPNDQEILPLGYGPLNYSNQYQRLVNGVPFLGNGANVQVSSADGQITSYNLTWNEVTAPAVEGVINMEQAQQAFVKAPYFKLQYWVSSPYRILAAGEKQDAKLVYQLTGQNGGAIDAFTGLPLELKPGEWLSADTSGMGGMGAKAGSAPRDSNGQVLTPQERQEVERAGNLLKQEEAIEAVKRWIEIPETLTLRSANLSKEWRNADQRIWSFDWHDTDSGEKKAGTPQYISARVNAKTGELFGFGLSNFQTGNTDVKLDRAAAQKLAEEFLNRIQPERFKEVALDQEENQLFSKIAPEPGNNQAFNFQRVVNDVSFPANGMTVNVDPVSGMITNFELNWGDYNLPGVSGVLSKEKAGDAFLRKRPLTLSYVRIYSNGIPGDLRLVYLPVAQDRSVAASNIIDAKTGELLDYQGQPIEKGPKPFNFTDLDGVSGAAEITVLGRAGLFGDYGNSFKPSEAMSLESLLRAMYLSRYGIWGNVNLTDKEILTKAKDLGWLKEDLKAGDSVNRELLAKLMLRSIQLNRIAELKDIYKVDFQDADQISSDALGYVAITTSSGILKVDGQAFAPGQTVSRAEAATALFRTLGWRN